MAVLAGRTPLIGRSQELAVLLAHLETAREKAGSIVLLSGEAGDLRSPEERTAMNPSDAIILHVGHMGSASVPGWLLLLPLLPVAALGVVRLGLRLWPAIRDVPGSFTEPP